MASIARFDQWQNTLGQNYGTVLQVKQTVLTSAMSFSIAAATGVPTTSNTASVMTCSITPNFNTSKILIMINIRHASGVSTPAFIIFRGTSPIGIGDASSNRRQITTGTGFDSDSNQIGGRGDGMFLDSPNTTSTITYDVRTSTDNTGYFYINRSVNDTDNTTGVRSISTITLMEIAQ